MEVVVWKQMRIFNAEKSYAATACHRLNVNILKELKMTLFTLYLSDVEKNSEKSLCYHRHYHQYCFRLKHNNGNDDNVKVDVSGVDDDVRDVTDSCKDVNKKANNDVNDGRHWCKRCKTCMVSKQRNYSKHAASHLKDDANVVNNYVSDYEMSTTIPIRSTVLQVM